MREDLQVQIDTFASFLEKDIPSLLRTSSDNKDNQDDRYTYNFLGVRELRGPSVNPESCIQNGISYCGELYVDICLQDTKNSTTKTKNNLLLCKIPLVTSRGTFIVGGYEYEPTESALVEMTLGEMFHKRFKKSLSFLKGDYKRNIPAGIEIDIQEISIECLFDEEPMSSHLFALVKKSRDFRRTATSSVIPKDHAVQKLRIAFSADAPQPQDSNVIVISERLIKEGFFTSTFETDFELEVFKDEELTPDLAIFNSVDSKALEKLDERGLIRVGTPVTYGDILIGKKIPNTENTESPTESKLLQQMFGEQHTHKDASLYVPYKEDGIVTGAYIFDEYTTPEARSQNLQTVARVTIEQTRALTVGDILFNEAKQEYIISNIIPETAMPKNEDGQKADLILLSATTEGYALPKECQIIEEKEFFKKHTRWLVNARPIDTALISNTSFMKKQRFSELDALALRTIGADFILQELLTISSEHSAASHAYSAILKDMTKPYFIAESEPEIERFFIIYTKALGFSAEKEITSNLAHIKISLASKEHILSISSGEVKKSEKYSSIGQPFSKPIPDGIFCEKIFGPVNDWECSCGKYRRVRYRGITCERCGVEVASSYVRGSRFGHILLEAPVVHPLFIKGENSYLSLLLDIPQNTLEEIITYEAYVVTKAEEGLHAQLKKWQVLTHSEYTDMQKLYGEQFQAEPGANGIKNILEGTDWAHVAKTLSLKLSDLDGPQLIQAKNRIDVIQPLIDSGNTLSNIVLEAIPVLPPTLRKMKYEPKTNRRYSSDLNDFYCDVIKRNDRLKKLKSLGAPKQIILNEMNLLQSTVNGLIDNEAFKKEESTCKFKGRIINRKVLKSLSQEIRENIGSDPSIVLHKNLNNAGSAPIIPKENLDLDSCLLPREVAFIIFKPYVLRSLKKSGECMNIKSAQRLYDSGDSRVSAALAQVVATRSIILKISDDKSWPIFLGFDKIILTDNSAVSINATLFKTFDLDPCKDRATIFLPVFSKAIEECSALLKPSIMIKAYAHDTPGTYKRMPVTINMFMRILISQLERVFLSKEHCYILDNTDGVPIGLLAIRAIMLAGDALIDLIAEQTKYYFKNKATLKMNVFVNNFKEKMTSNKLYLDDAYIHAWFFTLTQFSMPEEIIPTGGDIVTLITQKALGGPIDPISGLRQALIIPPSVHYPPEETEIKEK